MPTELQDIVVEARELLAKATPEPWTWEPVDEFEGEAGNAGGFSYQHIRAGHKGVADTYHASGMQCPDGGIIEPRHGNKDDANLITRAPELLRQLCDEVERLREHVKDLNHDLEATIKESESVYRRMMHDNA